MALLTYTLLRLLFIVGAGAVLYVLGVRNWLLLALAVLIGAGLSYVLLNGPRRSAAKELERRAGGRPTRLERAVDADAEGEDAVFEADSAERRRQDERKGEEEPDDELEQPGIAQDGDEVRSARTGQDPPGEEQGGQRQQRYDDRPRLPDSH